MSLFNDPITWTKSIAKSKPRIFIAISMQMLFITWGIWFIFNSVQSANGVVTITFSDIALSGHLIYIWGVIVPSLYLYALYRLLQIIQKQNAES
jgi:hypothetical protein